MLYSFCSYLQTIFTMYFTALFWIFFHCKSTCFLSFLFRTLLMYRNVSDFLSCIFTELFFFSLLWDIQSFQHNKIGSSDKSDIFTSFQISIPFYFFFKSNLCRKDIQYHVEYKGCLFWPYHVACEILIPSPGIEPLSLAGS